MIKNNTDIENTNETIFIIAVPSKVEINKKVNKMNYKCNTTLC